MSVTVSTLENGLRVATDTMSDVQSVTLGAWAKVGARNEAAELNGISHLLEHMAFKGTQRRDAKQIAAEIEQVGGHLNAYTSREHTAYYARTLKDNVGLAVDIISDILQNSVFDEDELAREKQVILQEIAQNNDTPDDVVFDAFQSTVFPDQAMGRPILGTPEIVSAVTPQNLKDYIGHHYTAEDVVFVAAGNIDHAAFVKLVETHFTVSPGNKESLVSVTRASGDKTIGKELEQAHIILGFEGVEIGHPDLYPLHVYSTLMGETMSSRLFQEIREKRGLSYAIYSFVNAYSDIGTLGIYAGTDAEKVEELVGAACAEIKSSADGLQDQEIDMAKAQLKSQTLMAQESSMRRCDMLGQQLLFRNRAIAIEEQVEKIEAVTRDDLGRMVEMIRSSAPVFAAVGPKDQKELKASEIKAMLG